MHGCQSLAHLTWECKYHPVIIPTFREDPIRLAAQAGRMDFADLCDQGGVE